MVDYFCGVILQCEIIWLKRYWCTTTAETSNRNLETGTLWWNGFWVKRCARQRSKSKGNLGGDHIIKAFTKLMVWGQVRSVVR